VAAGGELSNPRDFIRYPGPQVQEAPDGLKVDSVGNVWTSGPGGIRIISAAGKVLGQLKIPEVASNIAFGGDDRQTVYVTASHSVYRLRSRVAGQKLLYYR
jgi:gluconolactonase